MDAASIELLNYKLPKAVWVYETVQDPLMLAGAQGLVALPAVAAVLVIPVAFVAFRQRQPEMTPAMVATCQNQA